MSLADRINPSVAVFQYGTDLLAATSTYFSVVSCLEPPHETSAIQPTANTTMCLMFMTASRCGNYISNDVTEDNVSRFEVFAPHARPARAIHSPDQSGCEARSRRSSIPAHMLPDGGLSTAIQSRPSESSWCRTSYRRAA